MATPILSTVTGTTTGNASERIGQNATIAGTSLNDANTELLIRDPDEAPLKSPLEINDTLLSPNVNFRKGAETTIGILWADADRIYVKGGIEETFSVLADQPTNRQWVGFAQFDNGDIYGIENGSGFGGRIYFKQNNSTEWVRLLSPDPFGDSWTHIYRCPYSGRIYVCSGGTTGTSRKIYSKGVLDSHFVEEDPNNRNWVWITSDTEGNVYALEFNGRIYWKELGETGFIQYPNQTVNMPWRCIIQDSFGNIWALENRIRVRYVGASEFVLWDASNNLNRTYSSIGANSFGGMYFGVTNGALYYKAPELDDMSLVPKSDLRVGVYILVTATDDLYVTPGAYIFKSDMQEILPYQNITDQIQSSSETEIIFQTPEFELGTYKLAVENTDGISNELDFEILQAGSIPTLTSITGSTTGEPSERIGQNATIEGLDLQNITLLLRDPSEPLDLRPINRWKFEDNLLDSEGDSNGTATNAVYVSSNVSSSSKALAFNVANATTPEYFKVDFAGQNALNSSFSASFWAKGQVRNGFEKIELGSQYERCHAVATDGQSVVVVGMGDSTGDGNIYVSNDGGRTFSQKIIDSNLEVVYRIVYLGDGVFIATSGNTHSDGKVWRSGDYGANWILVGSTGSQFAPSLDYLDALVLVGGANVPPTSLISSQDYGLNFSVLTTITGLLQVSSILILSETSFLIGVQTSTFIGQIRKTTNFGTSFTTVATAGTVVFDIAKTNTGTIIALTGVGVGGNGKVLRSTNSGDSFSEITVDSTKGLFRGITVLPDNTIIIGSGFATGSGNIFVSFDDGLTFFESSISPVLEQVLAISYLASEKKLLVGTGTSTGDGDLYYCPYDIDVSYDSYVLLSPKSNGYDTATPNSNAVQIKLVDSPFFGYLFEFNATQYDINGDLQTIAKAVFKAQDYYDDNSITPQNVDSAFVFVLDSTKSGNDRAKLVVYTPTYTSATLEPISLEITNLSLLNNVLAEWKLVPDLGLPFEGSYNFQIDDLRVYDVALDDTEIAAVLDGEIEPPHPSYSPWQNITAQIQSSSGTEIIFQTPEFELGNYKIAVENEIGISNELDFTILAKAQALFRKLRNMFNQIGKSVSGDLISCAVSDLINPNGCSEFFGNLLKNGSFCETTDHWGVATTGGASSSSGSIVDREFHLVVNNGGSVDTDITISQHNILFRERTTYTLDIMAKTSAQTQTLRVQVTCGSESVERLITLGQTHTAFKIPPFTFFSSTFGSVRIFCGGAGNTGTIQIAYINLQELR
jgi:photosystem II stability/assembly factor-like uncharacterized protein